MNGQRFYSPLPGPDLDEEDGLKNYETPAFWAGMRQRCLESGNYHWASIIRFLGLDTDVLDEQTEKLRAEQRYEQ